MKTLKDIESLLATHGLSGYFEKVKGAVKSSVLSSMNEDLFSIIWGNVGVRYE